MGAQAKAAAAKEILRLLLEECGYLAYPFGYESALTTVKYHLPKERFAYGKDDLVERIRSMPDLIVVSKEEIHLVEVKFRAPFEGHFEVKNFDVIRYQKHWPESLLAIVSPHEEYFYAQKVAKLNPKGNSYSKTYYSYSDFEPLSNFFPLLVGKEIRKDFYQAVDGLKKV